MGFQISELLSLEPPDSQDPIMSATTAAMAGIPPKLEKKPVKFSNLLREYTVATEARLFAIVIGSIGANVGYQ